MGYVDAGTVAQFLPTPFGIGVAVAQLASAFNARWKTPKWQPVPDVSAYRRAFDDRTRSRTRSPESQLAWQRSPEYATYRSEVADWERRERAFLFLLERIERDKRRRRAA